MLVVSVLTAFPGCHVGISGILYPKSIGGVVLALGGYWIFAIITPGRKSFDQMSAGENTCY